VFNPDGTLLTANSTSAVAMDLSQVKIPTNGTYTVLIADYNDTHTGTYAICAQRTINPTGVLPLPFGQAQTGAISSAAQINSYTFSANSNDSIYLYMVGTSGNSFGPKIYVFKPDGTTLAAISTPSTGVYLSQLQIPASGTYTVLVGDFNDFHTSNYSVYAQRINNPSGAVPIVFGQAQTGSISTAGQSNSYTIRVGANDSISLSMVSTSGSLRPKISIFNPDGTTLTANTTTGTSLSMNQVRIPASGTYTVLVGDYNDTRTGSYNLSTTCSGVCAIVPDAPVDASAVAGDSSAKVSFSAPLSNGGSEITSYTVTSIPGNVSVTGSVSPLTVSGLTNDTPYSFTVTATNRVGSGPASAPSNNVTPHASAAPVPAIGPWGVLTAAVGLGGLLRRRRIWK